MKRTAIAILAALLTLPLVFVLTMYAIAMRTGLPGRRGGPQDAFRHTFTSAIVGKTFGAGTVSIITVVCERDPDSLFDRMDIHNNTLGAELSAGGSQQRTLAQLFPNRSPARLEFRRGVL